MFTLLMFICAILLGLLVTLFIALSNETDKISNEISKIKERIFKVIVMQDMQEEAIDELYNKVYGYGECCPDGECEMTDKEAKFFFDDILKEESKKKPVKKTTKKVLTKKK
jgi:hypothetical protein